MTRPINLVLLDKPVALDMQAVAQAARDRYPDMPIDVISSEPQGPGSKESPLLRCDDEFVVVMNMPAPAPRQPGIDGVWTRAALVWPQAIEARDRHRAHIIVATLAEGQNPLKEARILTAVIGGLLETVPLCSAVVWGPRVARPADHWKEQSRAAFAAYPNYPFLLWIDLLPTGTESGPEVITVGLSAFVGREIELVVGSRELREALNSVAGLCAYLIEQGDVIKDGDTFGGSAAERIEVRHATSAHVPGMPVLRITPAGA
jgi:hypothetical protein